MDVVRSLQYAKWIALLFIFSACAKTKTADTVMASSTQCIGQAYENRFIVQWEDGTFSVEHGASKEEFKETFVKDNLSLIKHVDVDIKIQLPKQDAMQIQSADVSAQAVSNINWGPQMVQAPTLWNKNINGEGVVVAVIDGMVDITHNQLKNNILVNAGEIPNNGIDDDNNGFVDDVYGIQVNNEVNDPTQNEHGSHVAGIIAADSTAGPIQGMAPRAKILPAQFIDNSGAGSVGDGITALNYSVSRGAKIINMSWGGSPCVPNLQTAMKKASDSGVILITAAGNEGANVDDYPSYPSAFNLPNQVNVAASTIDDFMIYFSNRGVRSVQVAAPGVDIYSTIPGNKVASMSGTSMAAPMTAGAAALLWSAFPSATAAQVRSALLKGVDVTAGHEFEVTTRGRINVNKSYLALKSMLGF